MQTDTIDNLSMRYSQTTGDITTTTDQTSLSHPYPPSFPSQPISGLHDLLDDINPDVYLDIPSPEEESGSVPKSGPSGGEDDGGPGEGPGSQSQLQPSCGQPIRRVGHPEGSVGQEKTGIRAEVEETQSFPATQEISSQAFIGVSGTPFIPPTQAFQSPRSNMTTSSTHSTPHSTHSAHSHSQPSHSQHTDPSVGSSSIPSVPSVPSETARKNGGNVQKESDDSTRPSEKSENSVHTVQSVSSVQSVSVESKQTKTSTITNTTMATRKDVSSTTPARPRTSSVTLASPALGFGVALQTPMKDFQGKRPASGEKKSVEGVGFDWGLGK